MANEVLFPPTVPPTAPPTAPPPGPSAAALPEPPTPSSPRGRGRLPAAVIAAVALVSGVVGGAAATVLDRGPDSTPSAATPAVATRLATAGGLTVAEIVAAVEPSVVSIQTTYRG